MPPSPLIQPSQRVRSIDALRGFVMFAMICVNDITFRNTEAQERIPHWLKHYEKSASGMTFVDVVFPAFLFIVGMSIPFALGSRLQRGVALWKIGVDILLRTLSLLMLGVFMVNDSFASKAMGWPESLWSTLMYLCGILAFCSWTPGKAEGGRRSAASIIFFWLRIAGFLGLIALALVFRGQGGRRMISFWPFYIYTDWFGILGLIGWAYLMAAIVYLLFRENRAALLACAVLLMCLYPAAREGKFGHWWFTRSVSIGTMLGSQAAISVFGVLLGSILRSADTSAVRARLRFALFMIAGLSIGAFLVKFNKHEWGINKVKATPAWCLWSSAITAGLWVIFYLFCDVWPTRWLSKPLAIAGQNVLLAYLLYNLMNPLLGFIHLGDWYERLAEPDLAHALGRAAGTSLVILVITAGLNRVGFRLRL